MFLLTIARSDHTKRIGLRELLFGILPRILCDISTFDPAVCFDAKGPTCYTLQLQPTL
jgi:hypothetical protein